MSPEVLAPLLEPSGRSAGGTLRGAPWAGGPGGLRAGWSHKEAAERGCTCVISWHSKLAISVLFYYYLHFVDF